MTVYFVCLRKVWGLKWGVLIITFGQQLKGETIPVSEEKNVIFKKAKEQVQRVPNQANDYRCIIDTENNDSYMEQ